MYRVEQKKTFLEKLGCEVRCIDQEELHSWSFTHDALWADAIIFCRLPAMYPCLRAISFAKQCCKKTYAEIDDLIFTSDYPAEFGYGLVTNKWLLETFSGRIGLIGADQKMNIIQNLMEAPQYQDYLGLEKFEDYISLPQKFACDDIDATEQMVAEQLKNSTSKIFLMGMGHVKSGLIHRLKKHANAVFLDVGASIDALAGIIDVNRPFAGDWTNYQIDEPHLYEGVDFLAYEGQGKHITLSRE